MPTTQRSKNNFPAHLFSLLRVAYYVSIRRIHSIIDTSLFHVYTAQVTRGQRLSHVNKKLSLCPAFRHCRWNTKLPPEFDLPCPRKQRRLPVQPVARTFRVSNFVVFYHVQSSLTAFVVHRK